MLTCILYLNPDWAPDDGGELRFFTSPDAPTERVESEHVDIAPLGGTFMAFLSERYWHEVLPSSRERLSLTGWLCER